MTATNKSLGHVPVHKRAATKQRMKNTKSNQDSQKWVLSHMAAIPDCVFFFPFVLAALVYERREWEGSAVIVGRLNGLYSDALWTASAFEGSGLGV